MSDPTTTIEKLRLTAVATLSTTLRQKGLRSVWMKGPRPIVTGQPRIVGPAFTVRLIPAREDISTPASMAGPHSFFGAIEAMPQGCVAVVDAMGKVDAGFAGDVGGARMQARGVTAMVTDGGVRDLAGLTHLGWPIWSGAIAAPPSLAAFHYAEAQVPIACGGVAVLPGDLIVADDDGAIVIPAGLADDVAETAWEKEQMEEWVLQQIKGGAPLTGLYPPTERTTALWREATGR